MRSELLSILLAVATIASTHADGKSADTPPRSIKGIPTGSNAVSKRMRPYAEVRRFVVDKHNGRVGVRVEVSEGPFADDDAEVRAMIFAFPQLRYDSNTKQILLGDTVVEKRGLFRWWRNPDCTLSLKSREEESKQSFSVSRSVVFDLYLETRDSAAVATLASSARTAPAP